MVQHLSLDSRRNSRYENDFTTQNLQTDDDLKRCRRTRIFVNVTVPPEQKNPQKRVFIPRSPWKATQANKVGTPNCKHPAQQPSSPVADSPIPPNGFLHPVSIKNMCCNFTTSGVLLYQNLGYRLHYSTTVFHCMFTTFLLHFAFRVHFVSGSVICDPCA